MTKKGIKATIKFQSYVEVGNSIANPTLLTARTTADVVDRYKEDLLHKIKKSISEIKIEDLTFEEVNIPVIEKLML